MIKPLTSKIITLILIINFDRQLSCRDNLDTVSSPGVKQNSTEENHRKQLVGNADKSKKQLVAIEDDSKKQLVAIVDDKKKQVVVYKPPKPLKDFIGSRDRGRDRNRDSLVLCPYGCMLNASTDRYHRFEDVSPRNPYLEFRSRDNTL